MSRLPAQMRSGARAWAVAAALLAIASPGSVDAQTILGRVLDQMNEEPVGGVIVALVSASGEERLRTLTDSAGQFVIAPPSAGEYLLVTERFGYQETRSPLIALTMEGQAPLELMVVPAPIGLEGFEVSVEEQANEELQMMGLSLGDLGNRWIDRDEIDAIQVKRDIASILEQKRPAGMTIMRPENFAPGSDIGLCFATQRGRSADGSNQCSLIVLNGIPISGIQALDIDPDAIEGIAVISPIEASTFYGTAAGAGAVLVWTRRGR